MESLTTTVGTTARTAGATRTGAPAVRPDRRPAASTRWAAFAFIAPLIVYLVVFYAYPLYRNIDLSLHDYTPRAFVQGNAAWVGLKNYSDIVASSTFAKAAVNTALFVLLSILFQYTIGLTLAVFFRTSFRLNGVLRGMFLVPWLLPLIVSGSSWAWMLNSDNGIVNSVIKAFGGSQINWLTSPQWVLWSVIIANIWLGIPFNLVILYSGLQNIPGELYEAASLDGANGWQQFRRITFPLLRPVSAVTILLGLIYTLKVVDIIWIMTKGGPADASTTFATWSYRQAFGTGQPAFSPAASIGNVLIVIALVFGFVYLYLQRRQEKQS